MSGQVLPPAAHIRTGTIVILTADTARLIVEQSNLQAVYSARSRDWDRSAVTEVLALIAAAASPATSDGGSSGAASTSPTPGLEVPGGASLSVREAAGVIGITPRAVRLAITQHRLPAQTIGGNYIVDEQDAHDFARRRRAA